MGFLSHLIDPLLLMFRRPPRQQYAALCYRWAPKADRVEVLLLTSRDTRRWVIPKGWPMDDKPAHGVAEQEAFEEAGVKGRIEKEPIGFYVYDKVMKDDFAIGCRVQVHALQVERLEEEYPEKQQRVHRWFDYEAAAGEVREPSLKALILKFGHHLERKAA